MGIFSNLFKTETKANDKSSTVAQIDSILEEHKNNLDTVTISLAKKTGIDYSALKSRVKLVLDYSGSMNSLYSNGTVQKVITQLFPFALKFDDDGELECYLFSNGYKEITPCNLTNYSDYVKKVIYNSGFSMGGTEYAPVLKTIHKKVQNDVPDFIIYITDGDNSDKSETNKIIREMSTDNCFIMFVGIGSASFGYLEKLDNLSDRPVDNTGFVKFANIANTDDKTMYTELLTEYSGWLNR